MIPHSLCRLCRAHSADSREHLFQSAIGGRLQVEGVLCKGCNARMGTSVDADLAEALGFVRMLLAVEGDRGQTASIPATDKSGRKLMLRPGGLAEGVETRPNIVNLDEDTSNWTANSFRQARQIVEAGQRKRPGDVLNVVQARVLKTFAEPATVPFSFGGDAFFRAAVKTVLVFLAYMGLEGDDDALVGAWRYVDGAAAGDCDVSAHLSATPAPWEDEGVGPVPHRVSIESVATGAIVLAQVRYFGDLAICIKLGVPLRASFRVGYGVDPFTGASVERGTWEGSLALPGQASSEAIRDAVGRAFTRITTAAEPRRVGALKEKVTSDITREVLGGRTELASDAQRRIIEARVQEEMAFIANHEDREEDSPKLREALQAAAHKVRSSS